MAEGFRRAAVREFFDAIARRYDRAYALSGRASRERLARVVGLLEGRRRVLVLGIGTGRELPALLDAGHEVTGIDVSERMVAELAKRSRTVPVVLGDVFEGLPFEAETFDAVIALHGTLAHPPAPAAEAMARLARESARVLRPGGVFVAEVPAAESLEDLVALGGGLRLADGECAGFVHEDASTGLAIEGVALARCAWEEAFAAPSFVTRVEPLPPVEHLVVALRSAPAAC